MIILLTSFNLFFLYLIYKKFAGAPLFSFGFFLSIVYFFYGLYTPYVEYYLGNFSNIHLQAFFIYNSSLLFLLIFLKKDLTLKPNFIDFNRLILVCLITCSLLIYKLFYLSLHENILNIITFNFEGRLSLITQGWVLSGYILNLLFVLLLINAQKLKSFRLLPIILFFCYIYINISIGNRRDFIPILFVFFCFFYRNKDVLLNIPKFVSVIILVNFTALISFIRGLQNETFTNPLLSNEFVYPYYTFLYNLENPANTEIQNIFLFITNFIPRFLWNGKPESLALQYVDQNNLEMGYAYMPLSDLFFIYNAFWFIPFIFMAYMLNLSAQNRFTCIPLFLIVLEFSRSEISGIIYQLVFYFIIMLLLGVRFVRK